MSEILLFIVSTVLPVLGTAGAGLLLWLMRTKFNLQISAEQEKLLVTIIEQAIGFAQEWAHKQNKQSLPVTGEDKLKQATAFAKAELARHKIKIPDAQVDNMLHAALGLMRSVG